MGNSSFTVVIPSSRSSQRLLKSVHSVLSQTLTPSEIIVIRNSFEAIDPEVLEVFKKNDIVLIDIGKPIGVSFARNIGIQHSKSEYIGFLDDDDEWVPHKLEFQADVMLRENLQASTTNFYLQHRGKRRVFPEQSPTDVFRDMALRCHCGPGSTLVINRDLLTNLGMFKTELGRYEDWYLMAKITTGKHKYRHLDMVASVVNKTEGSWASNSLELRNLAMAIQDFDEATKLELSNGILFEKAVNDKRNGKKFSASYALFKWAIYHPPNLWYLVKRFLLRFKNYS